MGLKGRPVSSLDEVRATPIDFDGSIFYFPSLANDKIYTKQINVDGSSSLKLYELKEVPVAQETAALSANLVTREEFTNALNNLMEEISALKANTAIPQEEKTNGFNF